MRHDATDTLAGVQSRAALDAASATLALNHGLMSNGLSNHASPPALRSCSPSAIAPTADVAYGPHLPSETRSAALASPDDAAALVALAGNGVSGLTAQLALVVARSQSNRRLST